jgi:hypothetical protein
MMSGDAGFGCQNIVRLDAAEMILVVVFENRFGEAFPRDTLAVQRAQDLILVDWMGVVVGDDLGDVFG